MLARLPSVASRNRRNNARQPSPSYLPPQTRGHILEGEVLQARNWLLADSFGPCIERPLYLRKRAWMALDVLRLNS